MKTTHAVTRLTLLLVTLFALVGSGCRSHKGFREQYQSLRPAMVKGEWKQAASEVKQSKGKIYKEEDRVMFWLNLGTLQHYAGQYDASMKQFVSAEKAIQDLWTKSISEEITKVISNESTQDYPGEDFEKVLVYFYTSLNRVRQGKLSDALVEARRADEFLKKIQVQYEKEKKKVGTLYKQDAFMLWLVGLFYEIEGSWSDAFLAYEVAYNAYQTEYGKFGAKAPSFLQEDLLRTAKLAGREDAVAKYSKGAGGESLAAAAEGKAEIVLIHAAGEAPYKKQKFIQGRMPDGYMMRIAIPQFVPSGRHSLRGAEITVAGNSAKTQLMEPVARIALDNYKHRLGAITARAIARAAIKYTATKGGQAAAKKATGDSRVGAVVGLLGNVASAATEQADLRAWTTLPAEINVTRLWVAPGDHTVNVRYLGPNGPTGRTEQIKVSVKKGERRILSVRTVQ